MVAANKTLEDIIREKFNTGYDPVTLSVKAKSINEENLEVLIEGIRYNVKGNHVESFENLTPSQQQEAVQAAKAAQRGHVPPADLDVGTAGQQSIPVELTTEQRVERLAATPGIVRVDRVGTDDQGNAVFAIYNAQDSSFAGTVEQVEQLLVDSNGGFTSPA